MSAAEVTWQVVEVQQKNRQQESQVGQLLYFT
jgi:hypothetical protein